MNTNVVVAIVQAAVELTYAGIEIQKLIQEAKENNGKLSEETLRQVEKEVANANMLWNERTSS